MWLTCQFGSSRVGRSLPKKKKKKKKKKLFVWIANQAKVVSPIPLNKSLACITSAEFTGWIQPDCSEICRKQSRGCQCRIHEDLFETSFMTGTTTLQLGRRYDLAKMMLIRLMTELSPSNTYGEKINRPNGNGALSAFSEALGKHFNMRVDIIPVLRARLNRRVATRKPLPMFRLILMVIVLNGCCDR